MVLKLEVGEVDEVDEVEEDRELGQVEEVARGTKLRKVPVGVVVLLCSHWSRPTVVKSK